MSYKITAGIIAGVVVAIALAAVSLDNQSDAMNIFSNQNQQTTQVKEVGPPVGSPAEYYIVNQELDDVDEKDTGIPSDVYSIPQITVHKGDKVTIHFYNVAEEPDERHTFTMEKPYKMNYDIAPGEKKTFSFTADTVGTFTYYCTYHMPTMVGHLTVLP